MQQVKIFNGYDAREVESDMNEWLLDNSDIDVLHMVATENGMAVMYAPYPSAPSYVMEQKLNEIINELNSIDKSIICLC